MSAVFVAGLVPRLAVPFLSTDRLLGVVADDAAYYLRLADEASRTGVPSMDGVHATNGFHPVWLAVLTPVARWVGDPTTQLRLAALLGVLCAAGTFVALGRLLAPRLGVVPVAVGLSLWWLSPEALYSSASGLEASLTGLLVVAFVRAAFRYRERLDVNAAALVGVCAAAVYLARSDAALAVVAVGAWLLLAVRHASRPRVDLVRDVGVAGASAIVVCLPWWGWNLLAFGTIEQSSAWAVPSVLWRREQADGSGSAVRVGIDSTWSFLTGDGPGWLGVPLWLTVVLLAAVVFVFATRLGSSSERDVLRLGLWLVAAGLVLAVLHAGVRLYPRPYYFEWVRLAWVVLIAATLAALAHSTLWKRAIDALTLVPDRARIVVAVAVIAIAGCNLFVNAVSVPVYPWQTSLVEAAQWLRSNTEPDDTIGSFNSGLLTLYSDRSVINLDGVANNAAADAVTEGQVARYICDQDLRWFVDISPQFQELYAASLGDADNEWHLEPVRTFRGPRDVRQRLNEITLFRSTCDYPA